jgi:hypothetical protein
MEWRDRERRYEAFTSSRKRRCLHFFPVENKIEVAWDVSCRFCRQGTAPVVGLMQIWGNSPGYVLETTS